MTRVFVERPRTECFASCVPEILGELEVLCLYCHHQDVVESSCLGTTNRGARCRKEWLDEFGYCESHREDRKPSKRIRQTSYATVRSLGRLFELYGHAVVQEGLDEISARIESDLRLKERSLADVLDRFTRDAEQIYFMKADNMVKIGRSLHPDQRLKNLQSNKGQTVIPDSVDMSRAVIVARFPGGRRVESSLHLRFRRYQVAGEWFRWSPEVRRYVEGLGEAETLQEFADKL